MKHLPSLPFLTLQLVIKSCHCCLGACLKQPTLPPLADPGAGHQELPVLFGGLLGALHYCFLQAVPGTLYGCTLVAPLLMKPQPCQWLWPAVLGTLHAGTPWATLVHLIWLLPWHQCHPHWKHVAMCLVLHPCAPCNHVAIACLCKVTHVNFILSIFAVTLAVKERSSPTQMQPKKEPIPNFVSSQK